MKAYLAEVLVIGFDNIGQEDVKFHLGNCKYINSNVISMREADIGEWKDEHPLNNTSTMLSAARLYFPE
jgi:hypothetical protein